MAKPIPKIGRPLMFADEQELLDYFLDYIDDCITQNKLPSMAGFRANKIISRTALFEYERRAEFKNAFEIIYSILEDNTLNSSSIDAGTKRLVLQSKFNYSESSKVTQTVANTNVKTPEEEAKELEKLVKEYIQFNPDIINNL